MSEVQAHFTQIILYRHVMDHPHSPYQPAATAHYIGEMTRNLYDVAMGVAVWTEDCEMRNTAFSGRRYAAVMHDWLGPDWGQFAPAKRLQDNITVFNARKRSGINALHYHAMGGIIAEGLFQLVHCASADERNTLLGFLCGQEARLDLRNVMQNFGICTDVKISDLARRATNAVILPLMALSQ